MGRSEVKLTKRTIDDVVPDPGHDKVIFDAELAGFGVRVKASGTKSYILQYRNKFGRLRRFTIARVGDGLTPTEARAKALRLRAQISDGHDPATERQSLRESITVGELCDIYMEEGKARLRPNTLKMLESWIRVHVKPLLGSLAVASLTRADLERFLRDVTNGKTAKAPEPVSAFVPQVYRR